MNLSCYILDDELHAVDLLRGYVAKTPWLELAGSSTRPLEALTELRELLPSVLFLDIDMPDLSGLDLAGMLPKETKIVFTTSYREYGPEAFERHAADYLLKPVGYARFLTCVEKIRGALPPMPGYFLIKTGSKGLLTRIDTAEILYVSGLEAYVELHLAGRKLITYMGLSELLEQLPANFSRIHKSHIINHDSILGIENGQVLLPEGIRLTIGRTYRDEFFRKLAPALLFSKRDPA